VHLIIRLILSGIIAVAGIANAHAEEHGRLPQHHVAMFAGVGAEESKQGHNETGIAIGLEYHLHFRPKWSIGADIEKLFGDGPERSWVIAMPLSFNLTERWRLFLGPGYEFSDKHDKYLTRSGLSYEFELGGDWSLAPEIVIDFISGGTTTYVAGVAVGYGF
jgi:hypothetical protein